MRDEPKKIARNVLNEDFTFNYDAFNQVEENMRIDGEANDRETHAYWKSVFVAILDLWSEGSGECPSMDEYHMIMTTAMLAEGFWYTDDICYSFDEELDEKQSVSVICNETQSRNQKEEKEEFDDDIPF